MRLMQMDGDVCVKHTHTRAHTTTHTCHLFAALLEDGSFTRRSKCRRHSECETAVVVGSKERKQLAMHEPDTKKTG